MNKHKILTPTLVVVVSFLSIYTLTWAASTVGTNLSTTGTLAVTSTSTFSDILTGTGASLSANFELVGTASISGNLKFGGSGTHTLGVNTGSGALTINAFTLGGAITGGSNNVTGLALLSAVQASTSAALEIGTYASISGNISFGGAGTHTLGVSTGSGALTINAFTLGGAITGDSNNITGLGNLAGVNASGTGTFEAATGKFTTLTADGSLITISKSVTASVNFEVVGYASASNLFSTNNVIVGGATASSSTIYSAEITSSGTTASTSILLAPSSSTTSKGTCLQLKDTQGNWVYARVLSGGTAFTVSTTKCHN